MPVVVVVRKYEGTCPIVVAAGGLGVAGVMYRSVAAGRPEILTSVSQAPVDAHNSTQISSGVFLITDQPADPVVDCSAKWPLPTSK